MKCLCRSLFQVSLSMSLVLNSSPVLLCAVKISKGLKQAYELQDFTHQTALALRESLVKDGKLVIGREDAAAICSLVRAWEACQERIRIHRNKPLPGSRKHAVQEPKDKRRFDSSQIPPLSR